MWGVGFAGCGVLVNGWLDRVYAPQEAEVAATVQIGEHHCLVVEAGDAPLATTREVTDLIGEALGEVASVLVVPVECLDGSFFELRSGFAGEVLQKAANYGIKFAVVGDVEGYAAASKSFHDLLVESKRSTSFFFELDVDTLAGRLVKVPVAKHQS